MLFTLFDGEYYARHCSRDSLPRSPLSYFTLAHARARRNCAKRDYAEKRRNGRVGRFSKDQMRYGNLSLSLSLSLSPSSSFSSLILTWLARRARGRTIDTLIYRRCTTRRDPELYTKRIYRRGGIIIFASPANDSSEKREPRSEQRLGRARTF